MHPKIAEELKSKQYKWLVTGVAGFIGSHLLETLLNLNQNVIGLDNLSTGKIENLDDVKRICGEEKFQNFRFVNGSIEQIDLCRELAEGRDFVLHQAALGSVSRSIDNPKIYDSNNIAGFVNMLLAARDAGVKRFVFASSSSVYGDEPNLPKIEQRIGSPLSPYALTKLVNEQYARLFGELYGIKSVGLRYFNVFGPRQDPNGQYAAVIPRWINEQLLGQQSCIFGDGTTSRDFCYVSNVVQANILAAITEGVKSFDVFNVALGDETSLNELYSIIDREINTSAASRPVRYENFRTGDVKHSRADISAIKNTLGYSPDVVVGEGLKRVVEWFKGRIKND